jgi:uncharacterized protein
MHDGAGSRRRALSSAGLLVPILALVLALASVVAPPARALEVPAAPLGRLSDFADLLSPAAVSRIESMIARHEAASSDQIAVAIFPSLDGESIEDFSIRLAEQWRIGSAEHDNGAILLIFVADRKTRLEVGYGLEGRLTDALSSRILRNVLAPRFRDGDYDGGVEASVAAIITAVEGEYKAKPAAGGGANLASILIPIFFLLFLFVILPNMMRSRAGHDMLGDERGWRRRPRGYWGGFGGGGGGGGGGGFSGGFGGGGGGFSGGGGSFGGGGASGGW